MLKKSSWGIQAQQLQNGKLTMTCEATQKIVMAGAGHYGLVSQFFEGRIARDIKEVRLFGCFRLY